MTFFSPKPPAAPLPQPVEEPSSESVWQFLKRNRLAFLIVLFIYTGIFLFIFRGVLREIPAILRGEMLLNADELVPIFNMQSQFFDQLRNNFSDLTNGYEFRLRYAVLTTWMRYYKLLPFALVFGCLASAFINFVAVCLFLRTLVRDRIPASVLIRGSALAVLFINLLLVQSKIIHFYTLILGFNQFLIALLFLIHGIFIAEKKPYRSLIAGSIFAIATPAVHYIVLYILVFILVSIAGLILRKRFQSDATPAADDRDALPSISIPSRILLGMAAMVFFVIIPYAFFAKYYVLNEAMNLDDTVPISYVLIETSSLTLTQQLTFDIGSVMDNFLLGKYTISFARYTKIFYFLLTLLPLVAAVRYATIGKNKGRQAVIGILVFTYFFSIWCGMGYPSGSSLPTFHSLLAAIANHLYALNSRIADLLLALIAIFIHVLRYPHRFQLIMFALALTLMPLGIAHGEMVFRGFFARHFSAKRRIYAHAVVAVCCIAFFVPLFCNWEYRVALFSGDFAGYLAPYPVKELREVKTTLDALPPGKTIVVPPSETQKRIVDTNGIEHKFIDKFYIYYLDFPSYYYGLTGDLENKRPFFLLYSALMSGQHWWINSLRNQNVRYVVLNKELGANPLTGVKEYLKDSETILWNQMAMLPSVFEKLFENQSFVLYEMSPLPADAEHYLLDLDWHAFSCTQERSVQRNPPVRTSLPNLMDPWKGDEKHVVSVNPQKTLLDLFVMRHPEQFSRPDDSSFAFNADHIPSSRYFGIIYAMLTLFQNSKYNLLNMSVPGIYDTLTGTFVGLPKKTLIRFPVVASAKEDYVVFVRGIFTRNTMKVQMNGSTISRTLNERESPIVYVNAKTYLDYAPAVVETGQLSNAQLEKSTPLSTLPISSQFQYIRIGQFSVEKGRNWLYLSKEDKNPMVVEGILLLKAREEQGILSPATAPSFITPDQLLGK